MAGGKLLRADLGSRVFTGVSTDSRDIRPGQLFIGLRGERFDGHDYIEKAIEQGAAGIMLELQYSESGRVAERVPVVGVADTHKAMLQLATRYLDSLDLTRIGITASNGKTTTKEFTYALLSAVENNVYRSPGNFNNLIGIPLALFAMPQFTRVAVLELGISIPGEMGKLAEVVRPNLIAILNVGPTHLEFLGSVEAVAREKLELVRHSSTDTPLIINADDPLLVSETSAIRKDFVTFGIDSDEATFRPESITTNDNGDTLVTIEGHCFTIPMFGRYQVYNLLAAYAITRTLGYSFDNVDTSAIALATAPMRGERIVERGVTFVVDCYNANPGSVREGLESFVKLNNGQRRIIVLGDMLELGDESEDFHRAVGKQLASCTFDLALGVGPLSVHIVNDAIKAGASKEKIRHCNSTEEATTQLSEYLKQGDLVYLKGSRGIGLEKVITGWLDAGGSD